MKLCDMKFGFFVIFTQRVFMIRNKGDKCKIFQLYQTAYVVCSRVFSSFGRVWGGGGNQLLFKFLTLLKVICIVYFIGIYIQKDTQFTLFLR